METPTTLCNLINHAAELANSIELLYSSSSARSPHHLEFYEHIKVVKVSLARLQGSSIPLSAAASCRQLHQGLQESYANVQKYLKRSPSAAMSFLKRPVEKKKLRKLSNIIEQSICDILLQQQQHENSSAVQAGQPLSPFELAMPPPPPPIKKRQKFVKRITKGIASAMRRLTGRSKESLGPVVTPGHHSLHTLSHTLYNNNLAAKKAAMMGDATPAASSLQSPRTPVDPTKLTGSAVPGQDAMHPPHTPQQQHPLAAPAAGSQSREWTPPGPQVHATNSAMSQAYIMPNSNVQQPTSNNSVSQTTPMSDLSTPLHLHVNKSPHWSQVPSSDGMQPLYPPNTASLTNSQASVSRPPMSAGDTRVLAGGLAGAAGMANAGQAFATGSTQHAGGAHDTMHDLPSGDSVALAGPPQNQMQGAHEMQVSHQYSFRTYVGLACPDVQPSSPKPHYDCSVQRLVGQLSSHTYSPVQEPIGIESEGGCCSMHASAHCEHVPIVEYVRSSLQAIRQAPQHVCQQQQPTPPLQNVQVQYNIVFNDGPESVGDKSSHPPSSEGAATTNSGMPSLPSIATRAHHPLAHQHQHLSSPLGPSSQSPGAPLVHTTAPSTEHETTLSPHSPAPPSMHDVSAGQTTAPPTISSHPSPRTAPSSTDAGSSLPPRHAGWQADVGTQAHLAGPGTEHSSIALSSKGDPTLSSKGDVVLVSQQHSSTQPSGLQSSQRDTHSARSSRKTGQGPVSDFSVGSSEFTSRQFSSVVAGSGLEDAERMVPADALTGEATAVGTMSNMQVPAGHSSLTWICSNLSTSWLGQVVDLRGHTVSAPPAEAGSARRHNPTVPSNAPMRLVMKRPANRSSGSVWEVCAAPRNAPIWVIGSVGTTLRNGHIDLPADGFLVLDATCRGVTLQNISVKGGTLVCYGGGCNVWLQAVTLDGCNLMAVAGSDVTLSHCTLLHCPVAIVASGPNTRLSAGDCEVSNNALGACADNGAQLLLSRITIKGSEGSGVECRGEGSCLQARQCNIGGNSAGWTGSSSEVFTNCVHAHTGGSVSLHACVLERTECGLRAEGEGVVAEARGCTIRGAARCGARVGPGAAAWIEGCTIKGSKSTTAYGIVVSGSDARADLLDCALLDNGRAAVAVHRAAAVGLRGCTLANSRRSSGIQVDDAASCVEASDCVIKENEVCGAAVRGGGQVELRGCSLTGPKQSFGVSASGAKTLIRVVDCTMDNNKLCGLHVARGATAAVRQCALGGASQRVGLQASGKDTQVDVQDCMLRKNLKVAARVRSGATLHLLRCTLCSSKESDGLHACDIGTNVRACDCAMHDNSQTAACVWKGAKAKLIDCALSGTRSGCGLHVSGKGTHATVRRCTLGENSIAGAHVSSTATAKLTACELVGTRGGPGLCAAGAGTRVVATKCAAQGNAAAGFFATRNAAIAVRECTGERNCRAPGGTFTKGKDVQIEEGGEGEKGTYASGEGGCILHVRVGDQEQQQSYLSEPITTSGKENGSTIGEEDLMPGQGAMDRKGISDPGLGRTDNTGKKLKPRTVQISKKVKEGSNTAVAATITGGSDGAAVLEVAKGADVSDKELASMMRRATFHSVAKVQESAFDIDEPASATHSQIKLLGVQARQAAVGGKGSGKR